MKPGTSSPVEAAQAAPPVVLDAYREKDARAFSTWCEAPSAWAFLRRSRPRAATSGNLFEYFLTASAAGLGNRT